MYVQPYLENSREKAEELEVAGGWTESAAGTTNILEGGIGPDSRALPD